MFVAIKNLLALSYCSVLDVTGYFSAARYLGEPEEYLSILMYHGIEDRAELRTMHKQDISTRACLKEIKFFQSQGYSAVSPGNWHESSKQNAPKLLVTFDDGNLNTFALLRRLTVSERTPILVAVCPQVIESGEPFWYEEVAARIALSQLWQEQAPHDTEGIALSTDRFLQEYYYAPRRTSTNILSDVRRLTQDIDMDWVLKSGYVHANMSWGNLAELVATGYCSIAAHSMNHDAATHMTPEEFGHDAEQCKAMIEKKLGVECQDYVYPFGSAQVYSAQTETMLQSAGYQRSYTTVHRMNRITETMALGRFTGTGMEVSPRYYQYLWRQRHATAESNTVAPL